MISVMEESINHKNQTNQTNLRSDSILSERWFLRFLWLVWLKKMISVVKESINHKNQTNQINLRSDNFCLNDDFWDLSDWYDWRTWKSQ